MRKKKASSHGVPPGLLELPSAQGAVGSHGYVNIYGVPPPSRGEGRNKPHFVKDMKRQSGEMAPLTTMKMEVCVHDVC